ncbi:MAG: hypothetical protein DA405_04850 [Bacteroidetes bacterium]|nr:MAG: hypothetical protein DA405_04850 [Bacteroidota bacterium]
MPSDFYQRVYSVVREIPAGRVCSYGAIAKFLGAARSSRMVGFALKQSGVLDFLPAHRVLNRNGFLSGKHAFNPPGLMAELLGAEGILVADDQVLNFKELFWDPAENLNYREF